MNELEQLAASEAIIREIINGGALVMMFAVSVLVIWINRPHRKWEINMSGNGHHDYPDTEDGM